MPYTIENWIGSHQPRLLALCERVPNLIEVIRDVIEGIERECRMKNVPAELLNPLVILSPDGKLVIDLHYQPPVDFGFDDEESDAEEFSVA